MGLGDFCLEWLCFQAWYEREAASFIGAWLRDVPEPDAFSGLTKHVVTRYATTADAQARVRARVCEAFRLEQLGRLAFDRRLRSLA